MYRIKEVVEDEIVMDKSRFIATFFPLENIEETKKFIDNLKNKYPKARHYCYAYIFDEYMKSSDDGEPSGTAGRPLLEFLLRNDLERVLLVVVRYFGGVKLGASNLLRTYVNSAVNAFQKVTLLKRRDFKCYRLTFDYTLLGVIQNILHRNDAIQESIVYQEKIVLDVALNDGVIDEIIKIGNGRIEVIPRGYKSIYL